MPIQIVRNDITQMKCDAIVNAANSTLLGGGGVDGAIHRAAGKGLLLECMKLGGCKTGQAKVTGGHKLPCRYVIHTVGPKWKGGQQGEKELLESCYRESLRLALEKGCQSVAFPLISAGVYGYPKVEAFRVAMDVITAFLLENDMQVYMVIFDKEAFQIGEKLFADIQSYIDDNYVEAHTDKDFERMREEQCSQVLQSPLLQSPMPQSAVPVRKHFSAAFSMPDRVSEAAEKQASATEFESIVWGQEIPHSLEEEMDMLDESFSQMVLRKIDEKGMKDAECYKKANVDRKLFSKIRSDIHYHPSKTTAIALAIALELSLEETKELLMKAGFALSRSSKFDVIIEFFIKRKNYNIYEINEALFAFDQSLLG